MKSLNMIRTLIQTALMNENVTNNPRVRVLDLLTDWTTMNQVSKDYYEKYLERKYKGKGAPQFIKEIIECFDNNNWLKHKEYYKKEVNQKRNGKSFKRVMKIKNAIKLDEKEFIENFSIFDKFGTPYLLAAFVDNN